MRIKQLIQTLTRPLAHDHQGHTAHGLAVRTALRAGVDSGQLQDQIMNTTLNDLAAQLRNEANAAEARYDPRS